MFVLGFCLFGITVLIPQFVQSLLGYTAEQAGLVISPGGLGIILLMPLVGFLVGKVDARYPRRLRLLLLLRRALHHAESQPRRQL